MMRGFMIGLVCISLVLSSVAGAPMYRMGSPAPQGNKVSLPDPPLRCIKTRKGGWVCFEGGRDV